MLILRISVLLLALTTTLAAAEFKLSQISDTFPSAGLENEIEFWRSMFSHYSERDLVFHDRDDLRIIYEVVRVRRGIRNDDAEADRQREMLKGRKKYWTGVLEELARGQTTGRDHQSVIETLRNLGYQPSKKHYKSLAKELRYQRGLKEKFLEGIIRSGRYMPEIEAIFRARSLPLELALMPHVESSFQYGARSKVGATGLWQFTRSTGRSYMTINSYVDQRLDPISSSEAAARHLESNFKALGSWPLAVTAYNHGVNGMKRAKAQFGTDFPTIARQYKSRLFGFASRNFYPELLAAIEVARNAEKYFGEFELEQPIEQELVHLNRNYRLRHLVEVEGIDEATLKEYNPALRSRVWKEQILPAGINLRLPVGTRTLVMARLESAPAASLGGVQVGKDGTMRYRVRRGDNLKKIATRFGVSVTALQRDNRIRNRNRIYVGQQLVIPGNATTAPSPTRYRVRRGDTLQSIARRFNTSVSLIQRTNKLRNANRILHGQVLLIP